MNRAEFLDILRSKLSGQMQEGRVAAHVRYYEDYIQSQVQKGRSEEQVLTELGDPRLIARTLLDIDAGDSGVYYEESSSDSGSYGYGSEEGSPRDMEGEQKYKRTYKLDLSTWYGKLLVVAAAAALIALLLVVIGAVLPFFLVLAVILFVISQIKKRKGF